MPRAKAAMRSRPSATRARPHRVIPVHRNRPARRVVLPTLPVAVLLAPILAFSISPTVREWALDALGYGLIPVTLWVASLVLALGYKIAWIKRFWRVWLASALLAAVSLGIMSMFHASGGVMKNASLGGYLGQHLGGSPTALGALKVAVLILLGSLLLFPRRAATIYRRVAGKLLWTFTLKWPVTHLALFVRDSAMPSLSRQPRGHGGGRVIGRVSISLRRSWRSIFGVPRPRAATSIGTPEPQRAKTEAGQARQENGGGKTHGWQLPSLELLSRGENRHIPQAVLQQMAQDIEATLAEHRVEVAVEDIRTGPRVIRFGLVPGWIKKYRESRGVKGRSSDVPAMEMSRVKVQSILMREKDMALALKTPYLRLEAPVPGESLVGLEVPNPYPRRVVVRSVAESPPFQKIVAKGGLPVALGEDTGGEPVMADLSELPHLLIAGATGSGKSVCINAIVASLLLTNRPDRLRMLMVDPKRVELTPFNGIPHLIAPVIVDTDEVLVVLRAIQNEMLRRFKLMEEIGVRNIEGYNKKAGDPKAPKEHMPFLVIIIDELADLMMAAAYEVEQSLVRLAQLGRATGIHLILATQRPSVNVVTGLLKANVPARIAFAVASQVDSRVILDSVGAEKLLGKGDMLLLTSDSPKPKRVQGTFVHDREVEKLVEFWQIQSGPPLPKIPLDERTYSDLEKGYDDEDDLLDRARELAERYQQLSPSVLQRRLQIGYSRAMRLMELLEDEGLIPPSTEPSGLEPSGRSLTTKSRRARQTPGS